MKRFVILVLLCGVCATPLAAKGWRKIATTTAVWANPTTADYVQARKCGIDYAEAAINQCFRGVPKAEVIGRIHRMKEQLDSARLPVWSVHLPFSRKLDISVTDARARTSNVRFLAKIIAECKIFGAHYFVLHPSSEPIADSMREERIGNAVASIRALKPYADAVGMVLCVEDLPRTCLGNTPEELVRIVDQVPGVRICFDVGHYSQGTLAHFVQVVGNRIATIHAYDYGEKTDMHWLPTQGCIDWRQLLTDIRATGYDGPFVFEATKDHEHNDGPLTPQQLVAAHARICKMLR